MHKTLTRIVFAIVLAVAGVTTGCDNRERSLVGETATFRPQGTPSPAAPSGVVNLPFEAASLAFWPYTGNGFDGNPVDPINLVFVGDLEPVHIRAALLALDGNRPGLPPVFPFDGVWREAIGDVQTGYSGAAGWTGSVIQLQLGAYDPIRFHLRLFRAGTLPDGRVVTLGAAHFELLIPKTTEHQVLSWELAEQIVVYDMARTGLLAAPPLSTPPISAAPSYREIPEFIYNQLPPDLIALIGGPVPPVGGAVPLSSQGTATLLALGGEVDLPVSRLHQDLALDFNQVVPKPFCADGPFDWVLVTGTVHFSRDGGTGGDGRYDYQARYDGQLLVLPVDITQDPPRPVGEPFSARVQGEQNGFTWADQFRVQARDARLAPQTGGMEFLEVMLRVASAGGNTHRIQDKCLEP